MPVPKEELAKLGITGVSLTQKELKEHMQTKKQQEAAGNTTFIRKETSRQFSSLTNEEINRAEQAAKKREESGK